MAGSHTVNADSAKPGKKVRVKKARKNRKPAVQADQGGEIYNGVNTLDEPSAKWGWHRIGNGVIQICGWLGVVLLLAFNFGNHRGHVETIWLMGLAVVIALGLIIFALKPDHNQVRKVTANNQPLGYVERDWNYDQKHLTGVYTELSDSQLRSLNYDPELVRRTREQEQARHIAAPAATTTAVIEEQ